MYMPDVYNHDSREVLKILQDDMGLKVNQEREFDDSVTEGYVVTSTPVANTKVEKGQEVTIVISKGPEKKMVTVPPLVNMDIEKAKSEIVRMELKVGHVDEQYNDEYAEGKVFWQSETGEVEKGTSIDLYVSKGPEPEPSAEPTPSDEVIDSQPPESGALPDPTQDVAGPAGTKDITVDLSGYEGLVNVRIVVGNQEIHNSPVDADQNLTFTKRATASGDQMVYIYINGALVRSYLQPFTP